jgi:hypothetical protein
MRQRAIRILDMFIRLALFVIAFALVVAFIVALDEFVINQRLYFLRTGNWDELITISAFGILIAYILKRLLVLQYKWGFKR